MIDVSISLMAVFCLRFCLDLESLLDGWPGLESLVPRIKVWKFLRHIKVLVSHEE